MEPGVDAGVGCGWSPGDPHPRATPAQRGPARAHLVPRCCCAQSSSSGASSQASASMASALGAEPGRRRVRPVSGRALAKLFGRGGGGTGGAGPGGARRGREGGRSAEPGARSRPRLPPRLPHSRPRPVPPSWPRRLPGRGARHCPSHLWPPVCPRGNPGAHDPRGLCLPCRPGAWTDRHGTTSSPRAELARRCLWRSQVPRSWWAAQGRREGASTLSLAWGAAPPAANFPKPPACSRAEAGAAAPRRAALPTHRRVAGGGRDARHCGSAGRRAGRRTPWLPCWPGQAPSHLSTPR